MRSLYLKTLDIATVQNFLQHAVAPRPICLASTIDAEGNVNLSPFSFFNVFSASPPILVFSPARRVRNNTIKNTLENVFEHPEVVVNIVDYDMVQQTSLASCEYERGVNEFVKAGFEMQPATLVRPPMVAESKIKMECKVIEVKPLGDTGGAGNLVICEVLAMHIDESILDENGRINQLKMHHVARLGGDWYCKVDAGNLFKVEKPNTQKGIGFDGLPLSIKTGKHLTKNHLAALANEQKLPGRDPHFRDCKLQKIMEDAHCCDLEKTDELHAYAAQLLNSNKVKEAWQVLLCAQEICPGEEIF